MSDRTEALENVARAAQRYIRAHHEYEREFRDGTDETADDLAQAEDDRDVARAELEDALAAVPPEAIPDPGQEIVKMVHVSRDIARNALLGLLCDWSEEFYCATWYSGLERILWRESFVERREGHPHDKLRELATALCEWPLEGGYPEMRWVSLGEAKALLGS